MTMMKGILKQNGFLLGLHFAISYTKTALMTELHGRC